MPWTLIKPYLVGAGAALTIFLIAGAYISGRWDGKAATEMKVVKEQVKTLQKVAKQNDKIDRKTPFSADKSDALKWLRGYTRQTN